MLATRATTRNLSKIFAHQRPGTGRCRRGLIEGKQRQPLERLVEEGVVLVHYVVEEGVGRLAAQLHRLRVLVWVAYCMICRPVVVSFVKATLAMRGLRASGTDYWKRASSPRSMRAGASFQAAASERGKSQGLIWATTPIGSRK